MCVETYMNIQEEDLLYWILPINLEETKTNPTTKTTVQKKNEICILIPSMANNVLYISIEYDIYNMKQFYNSVKLCFQSLLVTMYNTQKMKKIIQLTAQSSLPNRTTCFGTNAKNGRFTQSFHMCLRCVDVLHIIMCVQ